MDGSLLLAFLVYLLALIGLGVLAYRRTKTFDDFYLAGRNLNPTVTALSAEASSESGWLLLGLPGQAFSQGMGAFWVALGCLCGTFFNWTALAKRLRTLTGFFRAITIPDYLESRFDDSSRVLRVISALLIAIFMTAYVAAQFVALGKALSVTFGREPKPRTLVLLSRLVTLLVGLVGMVIALRQDPNNPMGVVFWLVLYAWGGLASSFGPLLVLSLYWKRVTRAGAIAGMLSGSATVIAWKNIGGLSNLIYELVPGFVVSFLVIVIVSLLTRTPSRACALTGRPVCDRIPCGRYDGGRL